MDGGIILNELEVLARKYGTDKQVGDGTIPETHGYTDTYYDLFRDHKEDYTDVLELGIWFGSSHLMWRDFFVNAEIYGVDNYTGLAHKFQIDNPGIQPQQLNDMLYAEINRLREEGISVTVADQMDVEALELSFQDIYFDVVIDDGGHGSWQQQISFGVLWDHVKSGGYYIIEDLAVAMKREFREHDDIRSSTVNWLMSMMDGEPFSYYITTEKLQEILQQIEFIQFSGELGIIKKK